MSTKTEGQHTAEFLVSEAPGKLSRDAVTVTVPASTTLGAGYVLGKVTATGKYVQHDGGASDGREAVAGILYDTLVNATGSPVDVKATIVNLNAEVRRADLQWLDEAGDETAGLVDLRTMGIKAR